MAEQKIHQAMANIYSKIEAIKKDKSNDIQHFKFRGIDDIYNALHRIFAEEGVFLVPEKVSATRDEIVSKQGSKGFSVVSTIKYTFYAVDGSSVSAVVDGEGADYGDKATSKSQSMAIKYLLLQVFMIPTEDMVDGDKETVEEMKQKPMDEGLLSDSLLAIENADTYDNLVIVYKAAYKAAGADKNALDVIMKAKDKAKVKFSVKK